MIHKDDSKKDRAQREELQGILSQEINNAEGGDSDELSANRTEALNYYFGKPRGDEIEDRSQVISMDVADMVNSSLAMLTPMLATDAVVTFDPNGEEDEAQAKAESDAVNDVILEDNLGFIEIQEAVKDALLLKNGCMKVSFRQRENIETVDIGGASDDEIAAFTMGQPEGVTVTRDGDTLRLIRIERDFRVNAVPIENISYQPAFIGPFQDLRFFAERIKYTRSALIQMNIDKDVVAELPSFTAVSTSTEAARLDGASYNVESYSKQTDLIDCYECYLRVDLDGDGIAERYNVLIAGTDHVLTWEPADIIPYALGSPFLNPHRITGESLFDHLRSTQDVKTHLKRQNLDNVTLNNNGRYLYDPAAVTEDDILTPVAGGGIRARNPLQSCVPLAVPDVSAGILASLAYEDKERAERGGASLDLMGAEPQLVGETAHGIERQYGSREALVSMLARNLSETMIKGIYLITHEYLRRWATEPLSVNVNGKWIETDPKTWLQRKRVSVKTGMTAGERGHLQQVLFAHMNLQTQAMTAGLDGVLANPNTIFRTNQDWLSLAGVDNPERLAVNPMSEQSLEKVEQDAQAARQAQQMALQAEQAAIQSAQHLEQAKLAEDARQFDADLAFKYADAELKAGTEEGKQTASGIIELEKQRMQNENATAQNANNERKTGA